MRLSKIAKDFNVGIQILVECLEKYGDDPYMEWKPMSQVPDHLYELLCKKFNKDKSVMQASDRERLERIMVRDKIKEATRKINAINQGVQQTSQQSAPKSEPVANTPSLPKTPTEEQIMKAAMKILGHIDLEEHEKPFMRKNEVERKAERQEKNKLKEENEFKNVNEQTNIPNSKDKIKDIWQYYVDIQEQLIKQRCLPITIVPESIELFDNQLTVQVDESDYKESIAKIIKDELLVENFDLQNGYIDVDENIWDALSQTKKEKIQKQLADHFIEIDIKPGIYATLNYAGQIGHSDQMTLTELKRFDALLRESNFIEGSIDDTVACIARVKVLREDLVRHLFGSHYRPKDKPSEDDPNGDNFRNFFTYSNEYIPEDNLEIYRKYIGLYLNSYCLYFRVKNLYAKQQLIDRYEKDCYSPKMDYFYFKKVYNKNEKFRNSDLDDINAGIKAFREDALEFCSERDIEIFCEFKYRIIPSKLVSSKLEKVSKIIRGLKEQGFSFNDGRNEVGIDFNWRKNDLQDKIHFLESSIPFIKIQLFDDHRYKCKIETRVVGYDRLVEDLEEKFEGVEIDNDSIKHQITIKLPCEKSEYYAVKRKMLADELFKLSSLGLEVNIENKEPGKIRLNLVDNNDSRIENLEDSLKDMRKADFGIMYGSSEISFGKLLKINYPTLVFDVDIDDEKIYDCVIEAFSQKAVKTIVPRLTGDLEKISRLKNAFNLATHGEELINPRLQNFIFDSSQATPTKDVDILLNKEGGVYLELNKHLLNKRINESQKAAIIKAMFADDMAVIQGPPGTGKSTAIAELIWQLIRRGNFQGNKKEKILLTSETNLAVDNAISRIVNSHTNLVKPIRFGGEEKLESEGLMFSIELMKKWVEHGDSALLTDEIDEETDTAIKNDLILKNWLQNIANRSFDGMSENDNPLIAKWHRFLNNPDKRLRKIVFDRYEEGCNVIGATCSSIGEKKASGEGITSFYFNYLNLFSPSNKSKKRKPQKVKIEFTTVIQDESSKATPAELVLPFVYGKRAIVIGDHRQLPPLLDHDEFENTLDYAYSVAKTEEEKKKILELKNYVMKNFDKMEISHFQNLYENIDSSLKGTFNFQYRMHPAINQVIEQFYRNDGGLRCGLLTPRDLGVNDPDMSNPFSRYHGIHIEGIMTPDTHVLMINSNSPEMIDGTSRVNYGEVEIIDKLLYRFEKSPSYKKYLDQFDKDEDKQIGIISFYGKQIKQLRNVASHHRNIPIRVSTVDRFQGMERNIVIVSMVRSHLIKYSKNQKPDWTSYPEEGYPQQISLGFAQSPNRLNVALSRAKRLLIIIGDEKLFSKLPIYQRVFMTIKDENNKYSNYLNQEEL